jgi:hypothetical protein
MGVVVVNGKKLCQVIKFGLIAFPVVLLVAIGLYHWVILPMRISDNQRATISALKKILLAEAAFRLNDLDGNGVFDFWTGDLAGLYRVPDPKGSSLRLIDRAVAEADAFPLHPLAPRPVPYHGYYFVSLNIDENGDFYKQDTDGKAGKVHNRSKFSYCAYPADVGRTGRMCYLINEANTVWTIDAGGKPILELSRDLFSREYDAGDD